MKKIVDVVGKEKLLDAFKQANKTGKPVYLKVATHKGFFELPKMASAVNVYGAQKATLPDGQKFFHKGYPTNGGIQKVINGAFFVEDESFFGRRLFGITTVELKVMPNKSKFEAYLGFRFDFIPSTREERHNADTISASGVPVTGKKAKEVYEHLGAYISVKKV